MEHAQKGSVFTEFLIEGFAGKMNFDYDFSLFEKSSSVYDHELCRLACRFVTVGYDAITDDPDAEVQTGFPYTQKGLKTVLDGMGFAHQEIQPKAGRDEMSYFLASRDITLADGEYNLIVAACIGSYKKTWYSNFDPYGVDRVANGGNGYAGFEEKGKIHLGFADARDFMHGRLVDFIRRHASGKEIKLLLTGHSRGAAAANLLAAKVLDHGGFGDGIAVKADNVYTYCFATPNFADTCQVDVKNPVYDRIFSIVNPEDFVTEVLPKACGFGKYGKVFSLMGSDNRSVKDYRAVKDAMQVVYNDYKSNKLYRSYQNGNTTVESIAKVMAKSMPDLDTFYNKKLKECFHPCTSFEYYKYTLCAYVSGRDTAQDRADGERALKLMLGSALDCVGTSAPFRSISRFFVFKEGIGGATGGKLGATYFSDSHRCETYLAYLMAMDEEQLIKD